MALLQDKMAEKERSEINTSGCAKRYFRFALISVQVAFVCLVVYEHVASYCRTSGIPVVQRLQHAHIPSPISMGGNKTKTLMLGNTGFNYLLLLDGRIGYGLVILI